MSAATQQPKLERTTFTFSRALEYFDIKELQAQTGQAADNFPSVVVKELLDNALDECESLTDVTPEVKLTVNEVNDGKLEIIVSDNGKGIPSEVIDGILDFNTRTTSKAFYRTPTRGQMGNALKTIFGIPFALSQLSEENTVEPIIIESRGVKHTIDIKADPTGELKLNHDTEPIGNVGTCITTVLEPKISYFGDKEKILAAIEKLCIGYGIFNPHTKFEFEGKVIERRYDEFENLIENEVNSSQKYLPIVDEKWRKFYPTDLPSPHWYGSGDLKKLIYAHINAGKIKPFGEFIREFRGLSSSTKAKIVKVEFPGIKTIADIVEDDAQIPKLCKAMQGATKPPSPSILGIIGEENLKQRITSIYKVEQFWYSVKKGSLQHIPYIVEVVAATTKEDTGKNIIAGLNFTPTYDDPFKNTRIYLIATKKHPLFSGYGLSELLSDLKITSGDNFILVLHLAYPTLEFSERAKSTVILPSTCSADDDFKSISWAIGEAVYACCREFYEHKKREEKDVAKERRKREQKQKEEKATKVNLKDAVFNVLPEAIRKASGNGQYPFSARTLYYQVRPLVQAYTNEELNYSYFTPPLLIEYQRYYGPITGLYYEPRGEFIEPHTAKTIPLGTREVAVYIPPTYLFNKILYIEKQGLVPVLNAARITERYDIGIEASQGYAVGAAKDLLKKILEKAIGDVTIVCLHDCDVDGLMIANTLKRESPSRPNLKIDIIDFGLSISEAIELNLEREKVTLHKDLPQELKEELSEFEIEFLKGRHTYCDDYRDKKYWMGERVELNALTSDQLIVYVERKLEEHGLTEKVCPPDEVINREAEDKLADNFTDSIEDRILDYLDIDELKEKIYSELSEEVDLSNLPDSLKEKLKDNPPDSWRKIIEAEINEQIEGAMEENDDTIIEIVKNSIFEKRDSAR